ncbi:hypothetical protein M2349_001660 [Caldanaerobacter subterraneus subsp. tengcongensis MB4]|nr:hypothetical protein [Caldanaerobacter subterraneus subsp. tengcongensis MB4]
MKAMSRAAIIQSRMLFLYAVYSTTLLKKTKNNVKKGEL